MSYQLIEEVDRCGVEVAERTGRGEPAGAPDLSEGNG
jgi:hypothetical protein